MRQENAKLKAMSKKLKSSILPASAAIAIWIAAATPAIAADIERPSSYDWSGPYVGLQAGYGWQSNNDIDLNQLAFASFQHFSLDDEGFLGGLHAGYNYTGGNFLYGIEGDLEYAGIKSDGLHDNPTDIDKSIDWLGSLRLRGGVTLDRALIYATGGLAFGDVDMQFTSITGSIFNRELALGWTAGAGVEYAITDSLTANIEYRYTDLANTKSTGDIVGFGPLVFNHENRLQAVRAGVSWHF
jgi:outer membrane immunogenic protein